MARDAFRETALVDVRDGNLASQQKAAHLVDEIRNPRSWEQSCDLGNKNTVQATVDFGLPSRRCSHSNVDEFEKREIKLLEVMAETT